MSQFLPLVAPAEEAPERIITQPAGLTSLPVEALLAALAAPPTLLVDPAGRRVLVADGRGRSESELARPGGWGTLAWRERQFGDGRRPVLTRSRADDVIAVARDLDRGDEVVALTLAAAAQARADGAPAALEAAGRLEGEVRRGRDLHRVSVRAFQLALLERLRAGEPLSAMCERGGFLDASGRADTSWLLRRLGLKELVCSRTGRARWARTLRYDVAVRVVDALDADPFELGV
jgi:hypothetical protein